MNNIVSPPPYIFLDTWALSAYTADRWRECLSGFLETHGYCVLVTSLSLTELYNEGWRGGGENERTARVARFLSTQKCAFVDPSRVLREEFECYPERLPELPLVLDLEDVPVAHRADSLLLFFRRHPFFLQRGQDIQAWFEAYGNVKDNWLRDTERIIGDAVRGGTLLTDSRGEFIDLDACKQGFLRSLDIRHLGSLTASERKALGPKIVELALGASEELPAVRLTSLLFWYTYVGVSRSQRPKISGSDVGDHFNMSLIPYCRAFCVDKTMKRILGCMKPKEKAWSCEILDKTLLEKRLLASRGHGKP